VVIQLSVTAAGAFPYLSAGATHLHAIN